MYVVHQEFLRAHERQTVDSILRDVANRILLLNRISRAPTEYYVDESEREGIHRQARECLAVRNALVVPAPGP